ncbi:MAG TPA: alanine racemase, partial [Pyrinomonadaceae bacterium]|nr:alanine racemase [Pyrinomonadaceae bacterium]
MHISELETPAVVVDLDVMDQNIARMAAYCREHKLLLRPHTKSHKIPELAQRQIASGAMGITVAKLGEAEVMLNAGITDILIAYPIVGEEKTARLARMAEQANITVALDSEEAARGISAAAARQGVRIEVLIEMDVGFRRCGLANENDLLALATVITGLPGLDFKGLMFFPGHFTVGPEQRAVLRAQVNEYLDRSFETFARADLPFAILSGGST